MAINKRERNLLIITIAVVAVIGNYLLVSAVLGPWRTKGDALRSKRVELQMVKDTIALEGDWQQKYDDLRHGLNQSSQFETVSDVLKKIDELAAGSGVHMQQKRSLKTEEHDVYREWPVVCSFEATTESLVKFLHGLQTASGFMTVEQLSVTAKPDNPSILRCDNVQIRALAAKGGKPAS